MPLSLLSQTSIFHELAIETLAELPDPEVAKFLTDRMDGVRLGDTDNMPQTGALELPIIDAEILSENESHEGDIPTQLIVLDPRLRLKGLSGGARADDDIRGQA